MTTIIASAVAGGLTLIGVILTNMSANKSIENKMITAQAVTDTKLDNLTAEVRKYEGVTTSFIERIPVLERDVQQLQEDVKELKHHEA